MMLSPSNLLVIRDNLAQFRRSYRPFCIVTVNTTESGYESFTDGALNVVDSTNGTGLVPSFIVSNIYGRWNVVELPALNPYHGIPPGVESGDYLIWVGQADSAAMQACQEQAYSYVEIEGQTFKLQGSSPDGFGAILEYRFIARKHKPVFKRS